LRKRISPTKERRKKKNEKRQSRQKNDRRQTEKEKAVIKESLGRQRKMGLGGRPERENGGEGSSTKKRTNQKEAKGAGKKLPKKLGEVRRGRPVVTPQGGTPFIGGKLRE